MAVRYNDLMDKLEKGPLTQEELRMIDDAEILIDNEIMKDFTGGSVSIALDIAQFRGKKIPDVRKELMFEFLENKYKEAGWKCKIEYGEDDGPNRPGFDYWVLTGKRK